MEQFINAYGFPIALAVYLLYQQRDHVKRCEKDVDDLWNELKSLRERQQPPEPNHKETT